jgi:hypothetical protein
MRERERISFLSQAYKARVFRLTNTQLRYWKNICEGENCRISEREGRLSVCALLLIFLSLILSHLTSHRIQLKVSKMKTYFFAGERERDHVFHAVLRITN